MFSFFQNCKFFFISSFNIHQCCRLTLLDVFNSVFFLSDFSVIIQLGAAFEGSVSRVELYDFVFDESLRTLVRNKDMIEIHPVIPWDNYERNNVLYVYNSEYCIVDCPSTGRLI